MANIATYVGVDATGHSTIPVTCANSGYIATSSGTAVGTVVNGGLADPTGTTNLNSPWVVTDSYGNFQITVKGAPNTAKVLRTIYFQKPYANIRPVLATITYASNNAAAGGTITVTMTTTSLAFTNGTAIATAHPLVNIAYQIL